MNPAVTEAVRTGCDRAEMEWRLKDPSANWTRQGYKWNTLTILSPSLVTFPSSCQESFQQTCEMAPNIKPELHKCVSHMCLTIFKTILIWSNFSLFTHVYYCSCILHTVVAWSIVSIAGNHTGSYCSPKEHHITAHLKLAKDHSDNPQYYWENKGQLFGTNK